MPLQSKAPVVDHSHTKRRLEAIDWKILQFILDAPLAVTPRECDRLTAPAPAFERLGEYYMAGYIEREGDGYVMTELGASVLEQHASVPAATPAANGPDDDDEDELQARALADLEAQARQATSGQAGGDEDTPVTLSSLPRAGLTPRDDRPRRPATTKVPPPKTAPPARPRTSRSAGSGRPAA